MTLKAAGTVKNENEDDDLVRVEGVLGAPDKSGGVGQPSPQRRLIYIPTPGLTEQTTEEFESSQAPLAMQGGCINLTSDAVGGSILDNYLLGENRFLTPQL